MNRPPTETPFKIPNIRYFIAFRIFFNSRFYYPVFTILFLDFGLSLEQFALLNVVWAITIVFLEVPSGALADVIGRRNLLVFAGMVMVVEIALICFAPMGNIPLLLSIFFINRVLSGAAEAAASGADEALAYDSLMQDGDIKQWGKVLEKEMRYKSIAFVVAMSIGAVVYDSEVMNRFLHWIGLDINLSQDVSLRFPLYLTLLMAVLALLSTLRMKEPPRDDALVCIDNESCRKSVIQAFKLTIQAGKWILKTPFALVIILSAMIFDHIIRMIVTLDSQYFRLIDLPEATFGLIGSGFSVLGIFIPRIALKFAENHKPAFNLGLTCVITLIGLFGMALFLPIVGLLPTLILFCAFFLVGFYVSYYLNRITDSKQRATVLSFKGLSLNGAYGLIGIFYSLLVAMQRSRLLNSQPDLQGEDLKSTVFVESFKWFPWYFIVVAGLLLIFARWSLRNSPPVSLESLQS
jgi:MFS family permease